MGNLSTRRSGVIAMAALKWLSPIGAPDSVPVRMAGSVSIWIPRDSKCSGPIVRGVYVAYIPPPSVAVIIYVIPASLFGSFLPPLAIMLSVGVFVPQGGAGTVRDQGK